MQAAEEAFAEAGFKGASMGQIAVRAGIPKPNVHYYFGSKKELYRRVLEGILGEWIEATAVFDQFDDPRQAIESYIRAKIALSRSRPQASKVFANEIIHGAPYLGDFLRGALRVKVEERSRTIESWIARGLVRPIDPRHLFFTIWASTQTYADFECQIAAVLGRKAELEAADFDTAAAQLTEIIWRGVRAD